MSACSMSLHGISSALICTTHSTVLQPQITLLIHAHYDHRFAKFALQPWSAPQTNVRLIWDVVFWMRQSTSVAHFEWRHNDRHWPIKYHHFIRVTFVTRMKSVTEHFIRVWKSYVYEFIRASNQTRLKKYMYAKFRVWYCIMIHV